MIGTLLFEQRIKPDGAPNEFTIIQAGIFDDIQLLNEQKPEAELYTDRRLKWVNPIEEADQFSGMMPLP